MTQLVIVDYGSGNLRSVAKSFERAARDADLNLGIKVTDDAVAVAAADRIVLPGVGAFGDCKQGLSRVPGMMEALNRAVIEKGRPFFGICVGMQLMADRGLEHGAHDGLGWIPGVVSALTPDDAALKIPHMGWNELVLDQAQHPLLKGIEPGAHAYFVHSYQFVCEHPDDRLLEVNYGGRVTAAVGRDNLFGTQFHPEKSQAVGLAIITNFLKWKP